MSSYYGRSLDNIDNISKLDNITFNGGTTYALTKDSAAFTPISSNAILISVSGVIQQGNFTVSGTNIVFNTAVASSESCDFIMHYGTGVAFTPADSSITKDKTNFISNSSSSGITSKGDGGSVDGSISLNCSQNSHHTKISSASHSSYAGNLNFVLPSSHGSNGQLMKTDGSGNLSFVDAPSGNHVLLASSASESSTGAVNFDNVFSTTYSKYLILATRLTSSSNNENIYIQMRTSGSNQTSSAYNYILTGNKSNTTGTSNINVGYNNQAQWMVTRGLENTDYQGGAKLTLHVFDPATTSYNTGIHGVTSFRKGSTGDYEAYTFGGQREQTGVVHDGISIYISGGSLNQHRIYIYGVKDS